MVLLPGYVGSKRFLRAFKVLRLVVSYYEVALWRGTGDEIEGRLRTSAGRCQQQIMVQHTYHKRVTNDISQRAQLHIKTTCPHAPPHDCTTLASLATAESTQPYRRQRPKDGQASCAARARCKSRPRFFSPAFGEEILTCLACPGLGAFRAPKCVRTRQIGTANLTLIASFKWRCLYAADDVVGCRVPIATLML